MSDEEQLIGRIARGVPSLIDTKGKRVGVALGIGDDALAVRVAAGKDLVVTVDAFIDGVHFWAERHPPDSVGYKALARATSDVIAMGATPLYFLMTLALPKERTDAWLDGFLVGMARAAGELGVKLVGGDTTQAAALSLSLTVMGEVARGKVVTRAGAKAGDILYVSGPLGRAQLGLELMRLPARRQKSFARLLEPHLYPRIRVELGAWLSRHRVASSMMDISDGLSSDLARLCAASGVGAEIHADRIPCVSVEEIAESGLGKRASDPLEMALHGGDDYELLFTVPRRLESKLRAAPGFRHLRAIGEMRKASGISLVGPNGKGVPLNVRGWDSFRGR
jgi:thiamine-monophosphate kinase